MRIPGICVICGGVANPAHTCSMCGGIVCSEHFVKEEGVCTNCSRRIKHMGPVEK